MRRLVLAGLVSLLLLIGVPAGGQLAGAAPSVRLTEVDGTGGLTAMSARPRTRTLYLAAQDGVVWSLRNGTRASDPVVDLSNRVSQDGGERGLLGLAFSPDGTKLYVDYTDRDGNTQIDELTMRGRNADASTRRNVLEVEQPQPNHNGGQLAFGPDGDLYIGLGDGGGAGDSGEGHAPGGNGQSLGTLLGKVLRIDPTPSGSAAYQVPTDNPFVATAGARPEIWAYGLRNPWRFSFDTLTGDLWIGDVGQDEWEEIDHVPATDGRDAGKGVNFGWNRQEGDHAYQGSVPSGVVEPVYEISHDTGACAVVGGYVFRSKQAAALDGAYVFSDNCDGSIRLLTPKAGGGVTMTDTGLDGAGVSSFGRSNGGDVYALSLTDGIFRLTAA
jgi:glucose/arabinose dehydrogenase